MGAHNFSTFVEDQNGHPTSAEEAYRKTVDEAEYQYGHDGYNGTISTTTGVFVAWREPVMLKEARQLDEAYWNWEYNAQDWEEYNEDQRNGGRWGIDRPQGERLAHPFGASWTLEKWEACAAIPIRDGDKTGWYFFGLAAS